MLHAYKHDENHILSEVPLGQLDKGSWINCSAPDDTELQKLNELTGIPVDSLRPHWTVKNVPTWNWKMIIFSS